MKQNLRKSRGFTFIQLMAVIIILAVIASIVAVTMNNQTKRSELSSKVAQADLLYEAVSKYTIDNGQVPTQVPNADYMQKPALVDTNKVSSGEDAKKYGGNYFIYGAKNKVTYDYPVEYIASVYNQYKTDKPGTNPMIGNTSYIDVNKLYVDKYLDYKPQTAYVLVSNGQIVQDINNNGTAGPPTSTTVSGNNDGVDKPTLPTILPSKAEPFYAIDVLTFTAQSYYSKDSNLTYQWTGLRADNQYPYTSGATTNYTISVIAKAADGKQSDPSTFIIKINPKNNAPSTPVLTTVPTDLSNVTSNDIINFTAKSTDPDGDAITYKWIGQGQGLTGNLGTANSKFPRGVNTVSVYAVDSKGNFSDKTSVTFTVKNAKPIITGVTKNPTKAYQDDYVDVLPIVTDPDGDATTFTITGASEDRHYKRGIHTLTFVARDAYGAVSDTYVYSLLIENKAPELPTITVTPPDDIRSWNRLVFNQTTTDIEGDPIRYEWSVNGGAWTATKPDNYYIVGTHNVRGRAIDSYNDISPVATLVFTVNNTDPNPPTTITETPNTNVYADTAITWGVSGATDKDGIAPSIDADYITGYEWLNKNTYYQKGNYTIQARAVDKHGGKSAWFSYNFTVINKPPTVPVITMVPGANTDLRTNTPLTFTARSTDVDVTDSISYEWINQKTYYGKGLNTVQARSKDSDGAYSPYGSISFTVNNTRPTNPWISMSPASNTTIKVTTPITFSAGGSTDVDGDPITYQWNRDGAGWTTTRPDGTYLRGVHTVQVRTIDNDTGISDSVPITFTVVNSDPNMPTISMSPTSGMFANTPITFYSSGTDNDPGDALTYEWVNKQTTYVRGTHTVQVRTKDNYGGVSPYNSITFTIINKPPTTPTPYVSLGGCSSCSHTFGFSASSDVDGDGITYDWQVDGGSFSSYAPNGSYSTTSHTVSIRARDSQGAYSGLGTLRFTWRDPWYTTEVDVPGHYITVVAVPGHNSYQQTGTTYVPAVYGKQWVSPVYSSIPWCSGSPPGSSKHYDHGGNCQYGQNSTSKQVLVSAGYYTDVLISAGYSKPVYGNVWYPTTYTQSYVSTTYYQLYHNGYWYTY